MLELLSLQPFVESFLRASLDLFQQIILARSKSLSDELEQAEEAVVLAQQSQQLVQRIVRRLLENQVEHLESLVAQLRVFRRVDRVNDCFG